MAEQQRQIKFQLSESEHRTVRLAAALQNTTMAEFSRQLVLKASGEILAASGFREAAGAESAPRKTRSRKRAE